MDYVSVSVMDSHNQLGLLDKRICVICIHTCNMSFFLSTRGVAIAFSQTVLIFPKCDCALGANVFLKSTPQVLGCDLLHLLWLSCTITTKTAKRRRRRCVGVAFWIVCLFVCVKVEVDRIAKHNKAVWKCVSPALCLVSSPQSSRSASFCSSLIFAAQCIELDPLPQSPGIWDRVEQ